MSQPQPEPNVYLLAIAGLVIAAAVLAMLKHERDELADQLQVARNRRHEVETRLRARDDQMDGALQAISNLKERVDELSPEA